MTTSSIALLGPAAPQTLCPPTLPTHHTSAVPGKSLGTTPAYNARVDLSSLAPRFLMALLGGFLLGSLPFSVWIGRRARGVDVRDHGTRNPGAANVWRTVGRVFGILTGAADAAKGAAAVFLAWWIGLPDDFAVWVGVASVAGHNFSPLLGFRGGKGGATTCGVLACFVFPELVIVLLLWVVASVVDRRRRFAWSLIALSASPLLAAATGRLPLPWLGALQPRSFSVIAAAIALVVMLWARVASGLRRADA
jgi:glycerol-3-phosphate acyltransferase PlsY